MTASDAQTSQRARSDVSISARPVTGLPAFGLTAERITELSRHISGTGEPVTTTAPFTGEPLAVFAQSTPEDISAAYDRARHAQREWAALIPEVRAKPFIAMHDVAIGNIGLMNVIQAETGKSRNSAFEETLDVSGLALYYGRKAPEFLASRRRKGAIPLATKTREYRHPKGVVGIISPWNYPLSLGICDAIPALLAGNAILHKPDTQTALTALAARELLVGAGLPPELWQIVIGDPATLGEPIIEGADHICFTGSTAAGRRIGQAAARRLIGCTLELGGKNPMLVLDDGHLKNAAKGAARACFSTAGQLCLSIERIYVAESKFDAFLHLLVDRTSALRLGSGPGFDFDIGTLTSQRQLTIVERHVEDARSKGATVVAGGRARPDLGPFFYEPTILTNVTPDMEVHASETFGPVVSVYPFKNEDHAVELANATEFGLNASVWTRDVARGRRLAERIRCGTVNINEGYGAAYASNDAPMGGMKSSGQGRRHGEHGILEYTELQTISSQHVVGFDPLPGISIGTNAKLLQAAYKIMKRLRIR